MQLTFLCIICMIFCGSTFEVAAKGATCMFGAKDVLFHPNSNIYYTCSIDSFDLNENIITGIHQVDKSDDDVKAAYCDGCSVPDPIFDTKFCQKFKNLENLELWRHQIEQINPKAFENCQNLYTLRFDGNKIDEIPENLLSELQKLIFLSFSQNQISSIAENAFKNQQELQWLFLSENQLSSLPPKVFVPLINLKTLELSFNQLTTIHSDSFGIHRRLTYVNFWGNKINAIDEKFVDNTAVDMIHMPRNLCNGDWIKNRDEMNMPI